MVKSYLEYIAEHFGAITIERPPEDMFVKNPNLPQPLSINTWVGGTGRIPMHWNNSPYLSGGFGGYQAILYDAKNNVYRGASESRKDGMAAGY